MRRRDGGLQGAAWGGCKREKRRAHRSRSLSTSVGRAERANRSPGAIQCRPRRRPLRRPYRLIAPSHRRRSRPSRIRRSFISMPADSSSSFSPLERVPLVVGDLCGPSKASFAVSAPLQQTHQSPTLPPALSPPLLSLSLSLLSPPSVCFHNTSSIPHAYTCFR